MFRPKAKRNKVDSFALEHIRPASEHDFSIGTYIIIFNAIQVPPHLLISHQGKVYSVSVSGRQMGSPMPKLESYISRKSVPSLFIEWKLPESVSPENFDLILQENFAAYPRLEAGKTSCLSPIRDMAVNLYGAEMQQARFIFELLPLLHQHKATGAVFASNIVLPENTFTLQTYTENELESAIRRAGLSPAVTD